MIDANDVSALLLCATNEGALYPVWCALARDVANVPDGVWVDQLRRYARELYRSGRYEGSFSAETINSAAAAVRDYYVRHMAEGTRPMNLKGQRPEAWTYDPKRKRVADENGLLVADAVSDLDAPLIVAAPKLYAAARALLDNCPMYAPLDAFKALQDALAEAEGEI